MRAATESWLLRHWYGSHNPPWYLRALEPVYHALLKRQQKKGVRHAAAGRAQAPLIVVGNITAGGSGKTPLVMHLCRLAEEIGLRPGIASTGYGRRGTDTCLVTAQSDTRDCGDEPVMLARRTGLPVVVARHRTDAIAKLREMDVSLIISDDGLQHPGLAPDVEICVVDGMRGVGNGHLLPAGPLREPKERLGRVDFVVTNGTWDNKPASLDVFEMKLIAGELRSIDEQTILSVEKFRKKYDGINIHSIAAIGNPQRFIQSLEELGISSIPRVFPDHHAFRRRDFDSIPVGQAIVMTEKDAVKCRTLGLTDAWYLPVDACLPNLFDELFKSRLAVLLEVGK